MLIVRLSATWAWQQHLPVQCPLEFLYQRIEHGAYTPCKKEILLLLFQHKMIDLCTVYHDRIEHVLTQGLRVSAAPGRVDQFNVLCHLLSRHLIKGAAGKQSIPRQRKHFFFVKKIIIIMYNSPPKL